MARNTHQLSTHQTVIESEIVEAIKELEGWAKSNEILKKIKKRGKVQVTETQLEVMLDILSNRDAIIRNNVSRMMVRGIKDKYVTLYSLKGVELPQVFAPVKTVISEEDKVDLILKKEKQVLRVLILLEDFASGYNILEEIKKEKILNDEIPYDIITFTQILESLVSKKLINKYMLVESIGRDIDAVDYYYSTKGYRPPDTYTGKIIQLPW